MTFLTYKRHEVNLQERFGKIKISVEPITPVDIYYTDGDGSRSIFKVVIDQYNTVYMPQMIYNVSDEHKMILKGWLAYITEKEREKYAAGLNDP